MSGKIEKRNAFLQLVPFGDLGPGPNVFGRLGISVRVSERRSQQFAGIVLQKKHAHGKLRGNKRIVGSHQIGKLAITKRELISIERLPERFWKGLQPLGPMREAIEPSRRLVAAEQFISTLAG